MNKTVKSFTLTNSNYEKLLALAEADNRSRSSMLDLILTNYRARQPSESSADAFKPTHTHAQAKPEDSKSPKTQDKPAIPKIKGLKTGAEITPKNGFHGRNKREWNKEKLNLSKIC